MSEQEFNNVGYKITDEFKVYEGKTLYRIELTHDCIHGEPGTKGGWISKRRNLHQTAWVADEAMIMDEAIVSGNAVVKGNAIVKNSARVYDQAIISDNVKVTGRSKVYHHAQVSDNCILKDRAKVYGDTVLKNDCVMWGRSEVYGGEWTESPFQSPWLKYFITHCKPGYLKISCETKTIKEWRDFDGSRGGFKLGIQYNYSAKDPDNKWGKFLKMTEHLKDK